MGARRPEDRDPVGGDPGPDAVEQVGDVGGTEVQFDVVVPVRRGHRPGLVDRGCEAEGVLRGGHHTSIPEFPPTEWDDIRRDRS
ncbi:hypothetical protein GCM10009769_21990 [Curtobacterium luteum]|uniref:Uncharacterized protein n=1 Tax=Curtobacterium luteum TaxID=33881 RepID=A0A8H9G992_9MICO|nr:hypothetical protein GCM10009769_21990 [Curtobacterium luteum]